MSKLDTALRTTQGKVDYLKHCSGKLVNYKWELERCRQAYTQLWDDETLQAAKDNHLSHTWSYMYSRVLSDAVNQVYRLVDNPTRGFTFERLRDALGDEKVQEQLKNEFFQAVAPLIINGPEVVRQINGTDAELLAAKNETAEYYKNQSQEYMDTTRAKRTQQITQDIDLLLSKNTTEILKDTRNMVLFHNGVNVTIDDDNQFEFSDHTIDDMSVGAIFELVDLCISIIENIIYVTENKGVYDSYQDDTVIRLKKLFTRYNGSVV